MEGNLVGRHCDLKVTSKPTSTYGRDQSKPSASASLMSIGLSITASNGKGARMSTYLFINLPAETAPGRWGSKGYHSSALW